MKRIFFIASAVVALLTGCSKDNDSDISYATAEEIVGTWTFEKPSINEVVVKGTSKDLVDMLLSTFEQPADKNELLPSIQVTFKADKTCEVLQREDTYMHRKGTYRVENGRLYFSFKDIENGDEAPLQTAYLEKKGNAILYVMRKDCYIDNLNDMISRESDVTPEEREEYKAMLKQFTACITDIYIPYKMVKK